MYYLKNTVSHRISNIVSHIWDISVWNWDEFWLLDGIILNVLFKTHSFSSNIEYCSHMRYKCLELRWILIVRWDSFTCELLEERFLPVDTINRNACCYWFSLIEKVNEFHFFVSFFFLNLLDSVQQKKKNYFNHSTRQSCDRFNIWIIFSDN